jgi:hypothetical protein
LDNITDTDGQVTAHNSTDNNEPTIELEPETMVIELSCGNEAGIAIFLLVCSLSKNRLAPVGQIGPSFVHV